MFRGPAGLWPFVPFGQSPAVLVDDSRGMKILGVTAEKGGSGKSTLALSLSAVAAAGGKRVLVVDADPQQNSSLVLSGGALPTDSAGLAGVLLGGTADGAVLPATVPGVSYIPAGAGLADAAGVLLGEIGRERRLAVALSALVGRFDLVLVDSPPTRSILTVNAIVAADELLIPVSPGVWSLQGLGSLLGTVDQVRQYLNRPDLRVRGMVLSMVRRDKVSREVEAQLRGEFGDLVCRTTIPHSVKVEESHGRFRPVVTWSPKSAVSLAFEELGKEVL